MIGVEAQAIVSVGGIEKRFGIRKTRQVLAGPRASTKRARPPLRTPLSLFEDHHVLKAPTVLDKRDTLTVGGNLRRVHRRSLRLVEHPKIAGRRIYLDESAIGPAPLHRDEARSIRGERRVPQSAPGRDPASGVTPSARAALVALHIVEPQL